MKDTKLLKLHELNEGFLYRCILSDRIVLINKITKTKKEYYDNAEIKELDVMIIDAIVYNNTTGLYNNIELKDNMLIEYEKPRDKFNDLYELLEDFNKMIHKLSVNGLNLNIKKNRL